MAVVHGTELAEMIVDGGESAKSLNRPGMARLLAMIDAGEVKTFIIAKLDRLTRSVKDLCTLLERFERRGVALVSVAESLDTGSAAGRLVLNIMTAVSQWEREAIGERTRDAMRHKRSNGERVGNIPYGYRLAEDGRHLEEDAGEQNGPVGDPAPSWDWDYAARDRGRPERPSPADAPGHRLAPGIGGARPQGGRARQGRGLIPANPESSPVRHVTYLPTQAPKWWCSGEELPGSPNPATNLNAGVESVNPHDPHDPHAVIPHPTS